MPDSNSSLDTKRHSFAHLMAAAVLMMFPEAQMGVGPVIENGCYYDFVLPRTLIPEDLPLIENHIQDLLKQNLIMERKEVSLEEAITYFESQNQPLKVELLNDLATKGTTSLKEEEKEAFGEGQTPVITLYELKNSETGQVHFVDLCRGPHITNFEEHTPSDTESDTPLKEGTRKEVLPQYFKQIPFPQYNPKLKELARDMRNNSTSSEIRFWSELQNDSELSKIDCHRQKPIGNFIPNFYFPSVRLVIEIDGEIHNNQQEYDNERDNIIATNNITIMRFTNEQIQKELLAVFAQIKFWLNETIKVPSARGVDTKGGRGVFAAFKLDKFSAAYWRGDQARGINMQRLYALVYETQAELDKFIQGREEAKKYDHRILGQQLDLFYFSDIVGPGLPLYTAKGTTIKNKLKDLLVSISKKYGVHEVSIPHFANRKLYEISGHAAKFSNELFSVVSHYDGDFVLKPVNCPHHTQIYAGKPRSYRDLPLRFIESTMQYRDEKPGSIGGLTRTRGFMVDDGHTFCRVDQIKSEAVNTLTIIKEFYTSMGLWGNQWVSISVRDYSHPENYTGLPEDWDKAEEMLKSISSEYGLEGKICEGEAALYGPKLDFMYHDAQGKERQLATVQIDFATPKRFELTYTDETGGDSTPVMLHRAILGSYERFVAILLEKSKGNLPFWLSPTQIKILTINDQVLSFVDQIKAILDETILMKPLKYNEIRYEVDDRAESLGKKIKEAKIAKIPMLMVIGQKDVDANQVSIEYNGESHKIPLGELKSWVEKL